VHIIGKDKIHTKTSDWKLLFLNKLKCLKIMEYVKCDNLSKNFKLKKHVKTIIDR